MVRRDRCVDLRQPPGLMTRHSREDFQVNKYFIKSLKRFVKHKQNVNLKVLIPEGRI